MTPDLTLWYRGPAEAWTEALPIGNGRLGAMVFGGVARDHLQLNEETLWAGGPYSPANPEAQPHLDEVRRLIFGGRYAEAEALAERHLMAKPLKQMSYQPAGDLWLEFAHREATNYRRALDLDSAVANTRYDCAGVTYTRAVFASAAHGVLVLRLTASQPGRVSFDLSLTSEQSGACTASEDGALLFAGRNRDAEGIVGRLSFAMGAVVTATGGEVSADNDRVSISGADEAVILVDIATSFNRFDDVGGDPLARIEARRNTTAGLSYDALLAAHLSEHRRLFRGLSLTLGQDVPSPLATDARVAANPQTPDPALAALYVHYGR